MQRGAGVDGRIEWVGEINSEPGCMDVELGTWIEESSPGTWVHMGW